MQAKYLYCAVLTVCLLAGGETLQAQRRFALDAGLGAGAAYYIGDNNPRSQFHLTSPVWEGMARMSLDEHHVLRASVAYTDLNVSETASVGVVHAGLGYEFNFFSFDMQQPKPPYTPYVFLGVGYTFASCPECTTPGEGRDNRLSLPFGAGVKCRLTKRWSAGLEWRFVKTCTDRLDGVCSMSSQTLHNNDWYSFALFTLSVRVLNPKRHCSSYL